MNIVRTMHTCPMCGEDDSAVGSPETLCDDCGTLTDRGWTICPMCNRLAMQPLSYLDQCGDCSDKLDAIADAEWEAEQLVIAAQAETAYLAAVEHVGGAA